jgi:FMN-dependent NADH-azoreductase
MRILFVDCCISQRGTESRTAQLARAFLDEAMDRGNAVEIEHLDLTEMKLEPFSVPMLNERDMLFQEGKFDDQVYSLARQFRDADGIVIGAPFWDLSFPARLRIYLEHISANGITYYYDEKGPHGNCRAGWLVYLTTGGDYERPGSIGTEYWRQLCGMYGIPEFRNLFAGGLDADPGQAESTLEDACRKAAALADRLIN